MGKRGENLRSHSIDNKKLDITPPYCYINIKIKKITPTRKIMRTRKSLLNEMLCLSEVRGTLDISSNMEIEGRLKEIDIEIKNLKKGNNNDID
jgi:hypothetical protein